MNGIFSHIIDAIPWIAEGKSAVSHNYSCESLRLFNRCADAGAVATEAVNLWQKVQDTIAPVLGPNLVPWLFEQTLLAARQSYPWLPDGPLFDELSMELDALDAALRLQTLAEAVAGASLMVITFRRQLERAIGEDLTMRLLDGVVRSAAAAHHPPSEWCSG